MPLPSRSLWFSRLVGLVLLCVALVYALFPPVPKEVTLGLIASGTTLLLGVNAILAREERHSTANHSVLGLLQPLVPPLLSLLRHLHPSPHPWLAVTPLAPPFVPQQTAAPKPHSPDSDAAADPGVQVRRELRVLYSEWRSAFERLLSAPLAKQKQMLQTTVSLAQIAFQRLLEAYASPLDRFLLSNVSNVALSGLSEMEASLEREGLSEEERRLHLMEIAERWSAHYLGFCGEKGPSLRPTEAKEGIPTEPDIPPFSQVARPASSSDLTSPIEGIATVALDGEESFPVALPTHAQIQVKPTGMPARLHLATPPPTNA